MLKREYPQLKDWDTKDVRDFPSYTNVMVNVNLMRIFDAFYEYDIVKDRKEAEKLLGKILKEGNYPTLFKIWKTRGVRKKKNY